MLIPAASDGRIVRLSPHRQPTYGQPYSHASGAAKLLIQDLFDVPQQQQDGDAGQVVSNVQLQQHLRDNKRCNQAKSNLRSCMLWQVVRDVHLQQLLLEAPSCTRPLCLLVVAMLQLCLAGDSALGHSHANMLAGDMLAENTSMTGVQ